MQGISVIMSLELNQSLSMSGLAIEVGGEPAEPRIRRLIAENPVVIFSRSSCCMCHVIKRLFSSLRVHPTVIELDEEEIAAVPPSPPPLPPAGTSEDCLAGVRSGGDTVPAVFIGGTRVGGLESLVALHLSGHLVPMLVQVGALNWDVHY